MADQAQPAPDRKPDAILAPARWRQGRTSRERVNALLDAAEKLMGVACRFSHMGDMEFVVPRDAPDADTCFNYPGGHELAGQPRYEWKDAGNGVKYGFRKDAPAPAPTPAAGASRPDAPAGGVTGA